MGFKLSHPSLNAGGTIRGDLVITGTLNTQGIVTFDVAQTLTGALTVGLARTTAFDAIILDGADRTGDGTTDSHAVILTAQSYESATPHDIDWKYFVSAGDNDGDKSKLTWHTRIDAASYVLQMELFADLGDATHLKLGQPGGGTDARMSFYDNASGAEAKVGWIGTTFHVGTASGVTRNVAFTYSGTKKFHCTTSGLDMSTGTQLRWIDDSGEFGGTQTTFRPNSMYVGTGKFTIGADKTSTHTEPTYAEKMNIIGGNLEVLDKGTLASESFTDGGMPDNNNWAGFGEWADPTGTAVFTFESQGTGTLTQTSAQLAIAGKNDRWYKLTYTTSAVVDAGGLTLSIAASFSASSIALTTTAGTYTVIFQSNSSASTADFVFDITGATGSDTLALDNVILKEIIGGNLIVAGKITGGGTKGLAIDGAGNATLDGLQFFGKDQVEGSPTYSFTGATNAGMFEEANRVHIAASGVSQIRIQNNQITLRGANPIVWATTSTGGATDLVIGRDSAANFFVHDAVANGATVNIYNTRSSSTNNELLELGWGPQSNIATLGTKKGSGGGSARALSIRTDEIEAISIDTSQVVTFGKDNVTDGSLVIASSTTGVAAALRVIGTAAAVGTTSNDNFTIIQNNSVRGTWSTGALTLTGAVDLLWDTDDSSDIGLTQTTGRPAKVYVGTQMVIGVDSSSNVRTPTLANKLTVVGGNIEIFDKNSLASESITDGAMPDSTNWAGATDWSDTISGNTTYTHSSGTGTLTQTAAQLAISGKNNRWYQMQYTVVSFTQNGTITLAISNAFAVSQTTLTITSTGGKTVNFLSSATASSADFVLLGTSTTAGDTFTIDDISIKEIIGGDIRMSGKLTGGGSTGIAVDGDGVVSISALPGGAKSIVYEHASTAGQLTSRNDIVISSGNQMGVGTASPSARLHVHGAAGGTAPAIAFRMSNNSPALNRGTGMEFYNDVIQGRIETGQQDSTDNDNAYMRFFNRQEDTMTEFMRATSLGLRVGPGPVNLISFDEILPEKLSVTDGNLEVLDQGTLGSETLTDGGMPSTTNWAGAGEWSDVIAGTTTYTFSSTGAGTLTQTAAQRPTNTKGSNSRWYQFTYTMSSVTVAGGLVLTLTNAFAASTVTLDTTVGTNVIIFQAHASGAATADFVLTVASASGSDTITMDDLILKEITGGNLIMAGKLTGGGTNGLTINGNGDAILSGDSSFLQFGTNDVPGTGNIRLQNSHSIVWRDGDGDNDTEVFSFDSSNIFNIGDDANPTRMAKLTFYTPEIEIANGSMLIDGNHSLAFHIRTASAFKVFTVDTVGGSVEVTGDLTVGRTLTGGSTNLLTATETHTLAAASSSVTTTVSIPIGSRLLGASFNVNTTVVDTAGDDTWTAAFSGGSTTALVAAQAAAINTKSNVLVVDEISSGTVEVTFTANGGNFQAGVIEVVVYYETLTSLSNV